MSIPWRRPLAKYVLRGKCSAEVSHALAGGANLALCRRCDVLRRWLDGRGARIRTLSTCSQSKCATFTLHPVVPGQGFEPQLAAVPSSRRCITGWAVNPQTTVPLSSEWFLSYCGLLPQDGFSPPTPGLKAGTLPHHCRVYLFRQPGMGIVTFVGWPSRPEGFAPERPLSRGLACSTPAFYPYPPRGDCSEQPWDGLEPPLRLHAGPRPSQIGPHRTLPATNTSGIRTRVQGFQAPVLPLNDGVAALPF
jgi:hypothetical protein